MNTQNLFNVLSDLGLIALESDMREILIAVAKDLHEGSLENQLEPIGFTAARKVKSEMADAPDQLKVIYMAGELCMYQEIMDKLTGDLAHLIITKQL